MQSKSQLIEKVSEKVSVLDRSTNQSHTQAQASITAITVHGQRPASVIRRSGESLNQFVVDIIDHLQVEARKAYMAGYRAGRNGPPLGPVAIGRAA